LVTDDSILLREAEPGDEATLWLMLTFAASMSPDGEGAIEAARADPNLRTYVEGWGRAGDLGVVAVERMKDGRPGVHVGAAWLRLGDGAGRFKVGDRDVPELATAVLPAARGRGIGAAMLRRLTALATGKYPAISLSVRESNPAVRFYVRLGFRETGRMENRVGGASLIMRLPLPDLSS
jgi:ribosomal protein S18 acetylase RimI-like enzyme